MITQVETQDLCVEKNKTILQALKQLDRTAQGVVFIVDQGKFLGTLSDGDIRRAIIQGADRSDSIEPYFNRDACWSLVDAAATDIQALLSDRVRIIPLVDYTHNVVDYASIYRLNRIAVMEPLLGGRELEYVTDCVKTNWISSQGAYVTRFQRELAELCQAKYCLATSNGTTALHLALMSLGIGEGDEVIAPDLTFGASINSIIHARATPVLVDVDAQDWNIDTGQLRRAISHKTKAIMVVHLYGNPCDMSEILSIAEEYSLLVVEDCAEALGATINGQPVGSFGHAAAFSFFGNKVITCGEGGATIFKSIEAYERGAVYRDHGMAKNQRYWHDVVGYNYRLTNLQAAVGCAQLEQFEEFKEKRKNIFNYYDQLLLPSGFFEKQLVMPDSKICHWLYTICLKQNNKLTRDELIGKLKLVGVDSRPVFYPMHQMPAFENALKPFELTVSMDISRRGLSLPSSVVLSNNEIERICGCILDLLEQSEFMVEMGS